jgi:hypothetical protein
MKKQLLFILLETEGCRNERNALFVILNEVKNLRESMGYKAEILRLSPQNDITTQSPKRGNIPPLEIRGG